MGEQDHSIADTVEVSFQIACPCGQVLTVGPTMVGQAVRCPRCSTLLEVPAPEEPAAPQPPSTKLRSDGRWRTAPPPRRDNFIADELKREAEKRPPAEPEKRQPLDPTPLLAVFGGTVLLLGLVGLGFYSLDRYIAELKQSTPVQLESKAPKSNEHSGDRPSVGGTGDRSGR
jgi:hypothetical protein